MANDNVQKAINSPIPSILKESIMTSIQMEISREVAEKKILQAAIIQSKIKKIVDGQRFMLAQISKDRQDEVNEANAKLDKRMILLQQQVTKLVNSIQSHIQIAEQLSDEYVNPLLNNVEENIQPIRNNMVSDLKHVLADSDVSNKLEEIAQKMGFDLSSPVENERDFVNDDVKYLQSLQHISSSIEPSDPVAIMNKFCGVAGKDSDVSPHCALIRRLCTDPEYKKDLKSFLEILASKKAVNGTNFLEEATNNFLKVESTVKETIQQFDQQRERNFDDVAQEMGQHVRAINNAVNQLSGMELKCKQMSVEVMKPFNWDGAMSHSKVNAELKMGLHHKSQELEIDDEIIPSAPGMR